MSKQQGSLLLLQKPNPANPSEFLDICGILSRSFNIKPNVIEEETIPCQTPEAGSSITREYGSSDYSFSGSGTFSDDADGKDLPLAATNKTKLEGWRVIVPGLGIYTGNWLVNSFSATGAGTGSMTFDAEIAQADTITFAPVV